MAKTKIKSLKGLQEDAEKIIALKKVYDAADRKDTNLLKAIMVGLVNANHTEYNIRNK